MKKVLLLTIFVSNVLTISPIMGQEQSTQKRLEVLQEMADSISANYQKIHANFCESAKSIQNKSICNVTFGCTKEEAKKILTNKYGQPEYYPDENMICFKNKKYAGMDFDGIHFLFQSDGKRTYFNACIFVISTKTLKEAKEAQKKLANKLEEKYRLRWVDEDTSTPFFYGGISPLWNETIDILTTISEYYGFHSDIIKYQQSTTEAFGHSYGMRLIYGPFDYIGEEF